MIIKKAMLAGAVMALASTPAWALPAKAPSNGGTSHAPASTPQGPPSSTPNYGSNNGAKNRSESGNSHAGGSASSKGGGHQGSTPSGHNQGRHEGGGSGHEGQGNAGHGDRGKSRRCKPHAVAYVAAGKLVSESLTENEDHTYSGELTVEVRRTNHHAHADKGMTVTYTVEDVHVRGPVKVQALKPGYMVRLLGRITFLPRKCESGEFTPTRTICRLVFHAPPMPAETETTETTTSTTTSVG